jgi:hypothetical protein
VVEDCCIDVFEGLLKKLLIEFYLAETLIKNFLNPIFLNLSGTAPQNLPMRSGSNYTIR